MNGCKRFDQTYDRSLVMIFLLVFFSSSGCGEDSPNSTRSDPIISFPSLCNSDMGAQATVIDIIDGDTVDIKFPSGSIDRVRYIGINTPEVGARCASEATAYNSDLVKNKGVVLIQDISNRDKYDRLLRYVCVGDQFVNGQLVSSGYAEAVAYPPDTKYADYLEQLENDAKTFARGCLNNAGGSTGGSSCCKICTTGKACGDTCIKKEFTCTTPPGCACNG